jgi:hypothetical protein
MSASDAAFQHQENRTDFLIGKYDEFKSGQQIAARFLRGYQEPKAWLLNQHIRGRISIEKCVLRRPKRTGQKCNHFS